MNFGLFFKLQVFISIIIVGSWSTPVTFACETTDVSTKIMKALPGLQSRVYGGRDIEGVKAELEELSEKTNCYEARLLRSMGIEAEAFSKDPDIALSTLNLLYQNTSVDHPRYQPMMFAIVRNFAIQGRAAEIETMIDRHPAIESRIADYWVTSLAIVQAQNGDLESAQATVAAFMELDDLSLSHFQTASAIYERIGDQAALEQLMEQARNQFGTLEALAGYPGMEGDNFDILYQMRFDPELFQPTAIKPPRPTYPARAAERGLQGSCKVWFDLSTEGKPINVKADCSSKAFVLESERAISKARFEPLMYRGKAYIKTGIFYPLDYTLGRPR